MVGGSSSNFGDLPSMDLRNERGRLNTGFGVVGIGGFGKGLSGREWGYVGRGESVTEVGFVIMGSGGAISDGDMGGEPRSIKEPWTGLGS